MQSDDATDSRLQAGLVEETISLMHAGMMPTDPAAKAVGYKQIMEYVAADWGVRVTKPWQARRRGFLRVLNRFQAATRQYARKQISWYRNKVILTWA